MTVQTLSQTKNKLWIAAIKPPMYSVAVMPIWVGSAIAFAHTKILLWQPFFMFLISSILILAWLNLSNDVFDSETGVDRNKPHSIVNLTGNKSLIFWIANLCLFLGILGVGAIAWWQKDVTVFVGVLLCVALGYIYQGPPFRLSYKGLGEMICFFAFGPLAVSAAYYSQTQSWSIASLCASVVVGTLTSLILFCSHFHQVEDDLAFGKLSPIVRLGTKRGARVLRWLCAIAFVPIPFSIALGIFPVWSCLGFAGIPLAKKLDVLVGTYHDCPERVKNCKFIAVGVHFLSCLLLGASFFVPSFEFAF